MQEFAAVLRFLASRYSVHGRGWWESRVRVWGGDFCDFSDKIKSVDESRVLSRPSNDTASSELQQQSLAVSSFMSKGVFVHILFPLCVQTTAWESPIQRFVFLCVADIVTCVRVCLRVCRVMAPAPRSTSLPQPIPVIGLARSKLCGIGGHFLCRRSGSTGSFLQLQTLSC